MNELDFIFNRRSIRRYTDKKIESVKINLLLKAAMYAPSAVNKQPWHFVVIDDRSLMLKVTEIHRNAGMLKNASHAIVICGDLKLQHDEGYWVVDCGAATENLLLAAHVLGLGACWVGLHPREARENAVAALLDLPSHVRPFALVSLGYPAEKIPRPERFKADRIHLNTWGEPYQAE
ncbi:MAG TPA: nitroreductase family protein [Bacteroidaceae bacterium]|nr:nitroreductase family protein [Bacteroidaceae bacterium]